MKIKQKIINKQTKKNCTKDGESIIKILQKKRKLQKEIMITLEVKICQTWMGKEEKKYEKSL